ncbi:MAG TPA: HAMP domain-containing sensor histidine kinase [Anaerolineae bacterium]|nr:HAMP domain-containing sensor histidine kinase [Anaerolineae bacterium]
MKRLLIFLLLIMPGLALGFLALFPQYDLALPAPLLHFYVVTFTTFTAVVISILLLTALGAETRARHRLAAGAFAFMGAVFFTHGFATPGALIDHVHPMVDWSAWITLFTGGVIFALASLDGPAETPGWLSVRRILAVILGLIAVYLIVAVLFPQVLTFINTQAAPWHRFTIFALTLLLWWFAAYRLWRTWRVTRSSVDAALAGVAVWLGWATISMHNFPSMHVSWWLYHFILLLSFLYTIYVLVHAYEHARQFSLVRYYVAVSLIATALLALLASGLFAEFAYRNFVAQIESSTRAMLSMMTQEMANALPVEIAPNEARQAVAQSLAKLDMPGARLYDANGTLIFPNNEYGDNAAAIDQTNFARALQGQFASQVRSPDNPPPGYVSSSDQYVVETYAPVYGGANSGRVPIGVLVAVEGVGALGQVLLNARLTGLLIAVVTMGLLFVALFFVVRRADRIITTRTTELETAYSDLRASENIRNDLTYMIVHDLRNPLTSIAVSLDLITRANADGQSELRSRFVSNAKGAALRMTGLIDDMLSVSKIESGELKPQIQEVALAELLADRVGGFAAQAQSQEKSLMFNCPPDLIVPLDPALIGRVVDNLISNAFKYTDEGTGRIQISGCVEDSRVAVHVIDNGEGVPDDYKDKIFAKFVQAPDAKRSLRKGTGLGLTFCRLVVEAHHGEIKVQDAPDGGSDFVLWIPAQS